MEQTPKTTRPPTADDRCSALEPWPRYFLVSTAIHKNNLLGILKTLQAEIIAYKFKCVTCE